MTKISLHLLSNACAAFRRFASEEVDYEKADKYANYIVSFLKISENHPRYKEAESKIKEWLGTPEGQQALSLAYSLFLNGLEHGKHLQQKLVNFIPFLTGEIKREMVGYLEPEYAKKWLHDPEVEDIVTSILGITPDLEYQDIWKDKEISDSSITTTPELKQKRPISQETADEAAKLLEDFGLKFGPQNPKLN